MSLVLHFPPHRQASPILRTETANRENIVELVGRTTEKCFQNHAKGERRNGVEHKDDDGGDQVKGASVAQGFDDSERDTDQIGEDESADTKRKRDRESLHDQLPNRFVVVFVGVGAHPHQVAKQPDSVANEERFIESELPLDGATLVFTDADATGIAAACLA